MPLFPFSPVLAAFSFSFSDFYRDKIVPWWWNFSEVFVGEDLMIQLGCAVGAVVLAYILSLGLKPFFKKMEVAIESRDDWVEETIDWVSANLFRVVVTGLLWSASLYFDGQNQLQAVAPVAPVAPAAEVQAVEGAADVLVTTGGITVSQNTGEAKEPAETIQQSVSVKNYILLRAFASIATLLLVSGALPASIKRQSYYKMLFFVLALGLILNLLGIWTPIRDGLNAIKLLPVSESLETRVTVLTLVKGVVAILILIPLTGWLMRLTEKRVVHMKSVSPAFQVLTVKLAKAVFIVGAILFVISSVGVNMSAFAFMGGAVGLGLGFGFQKVVSNLISGVILLGDKSIKPGDVIQVDDTYGWINTLGARYTSVITRDGTEHLIPNEMMITEKVVNWSFSNDDVRIKIPFGVSYRSDIHKVMKIALEAAKANARVLENPAAVVRMMGFGDSSVDFELRVWIQDPTGGLNNIRSDLYVALWDTFQEHDIEIPFPQHDLHLRDSAPIEVRVTKGGENG